jgi:hypothetical protein
MKAGAFPYFQDAQSLHGFYPRVKLFLDPQREPADLFIYPFAPNYLPGIAHEELLICTKKYSTSQVGSNCLGSLASAETRPSELISLPPSRPFDPPRLHAPGFADPPATRISHETSLDPLAPSEECIATHQEISMKALFAILVSCVLVPEQGMATSPRKPSSTVNSPAVCEHEAQQLANYIEHLSWGKVKGYVPVTMKASHEDRAYTYFVKVGNSKGESASGYTYQIDITQDYRSEACIVTNVSTDGTDQAE